MSVRVHGFEQCGFGMTLRTIGNTYLMQRSDLPMTDVEFRYAREYAAKKMKADSHTEFESDEQRYVYYGRLIGEEVFQRRMTAEINTNVARSTNEAGKIEREPEKCAEPLNQSYSTAFVPQKQ